MDHLCCNGEECVSPGIFPVKRERKECRACLQRKSRERNQRTIEENRGEKLKETLRRADIERSQGSFSSKPRNLKNVLTPFKELERKLDVILPKYTKQRDLNEMDEIKCISCPLVSSREYFENGHYYKRSKRSVRWDEVNNNQQCVECNREDDDVKYRKGLIARYGLAAVEELDLRANSPVKYSVLELEEMYQYFLRKTM